MLQSSTLYPGEGKPSEYSCSSCGRLPNNCPNPGAICSGEPDFDGWVPKGRQLRRSFPAKEFIMPAGQRKLLEICKKHIKDNELTEAVEVIDALLSASEQK